VVEYPVGLEYEAEAFEVPECVAEDAVALPYGGTGAVVYMPAFVENETTGVEVL